VWAPHRGDDLERADAGDDDAALDRDVALRERDAGPPAARRRRRGSTVRARAIECVASLRESDSRRRGQLNAAASNGARPWRRNRF
jgi:hypothetical protein